ncbi:hypothetical protein LIER_10579 [Lithospermum erythrorhizon]|uniref:Uncharacterized protein n=1 Tax=Lithospermum erythrorhizon TaxID=34254 RepID=A0AAV3PNU7_LITER
MEDSGSTNSSIAGDLSVICDSAADPPDPSSEIRDQTTLNDLAKCTDDSLNFQDSQKLTCDLIPSQEKDDTISLVKEDKSDDHYGTEISNACTKKYLDKCATFPCSSEISPGVDNMENGQTSAALEQSSPDFVTRSCLRSTSLPSTLKLVPAIKGSREKLGNPPRKASVTWAPDVYDPVPTAVSHVPSNKSQRHRSDNKNNGKKKQKGGKSSRGSNKSKDKKQARKGSSRSCKALVDDFPEAPPESSANMADFEVGNPDACCGSSFLKESVEQLHFPVAEAT